MTEEAYENCKKEMHIFDWLISKRFKTNEAIWILNKMSDNCIHLGAALMELEIFKMAESNEQIKLFQPNCS